MSPTQNTGTLQKFALEGPLSMGQLILLGSVMAVVIGFFAWRDYKAAASRKLLAFLFLPRLAALLVVLWMLAGPSLVTMSRQFKPKSIIVLADDSGSMGLIDAPDGSGGTLQWSTTQSVPALATLDRVIGTLCSAQSAAGRVRQINKTADESRQSKELWEQIRQSLDSAAGDLGGLTLDVARTDPESRAELGRVSAFLKGGLARISASQPTGRTTRQTQDDRLDEMSAFIAGGIRRVEHLAQKIASQYEQTPLSREQSDLAAESKLTREEKVTAWLEADEDSWLKDLATKTRVLRYKFASNVLPVPDRDWRNALVLQTNLDTGGTDLGAALNQAVQDAGRQSVNAVVLITDGGHNAPGDPREAATSLRGVPLFIVPIGSSVVPRDVILHHIQCPRAAFKNDTVVVDAMVTAYFCEGEQVRVELWSDDAVVDSQTLTASSPVFDGRVSFQWKAAALGRHILKVRAVPLPRERSLDNNEAQTEVEVMENTIRVLLADDLPRWEFRYLAMLFKRDKHVDFDQLIFEPTDDSEAAADRPSFPQDLEGWRRYRVVILGDVTPAELPPAQQELLRKYVAEDGGNLVVIAGETAMPEAFAGQPLGEMIPALTEAIDPSQGFSLAVTAEGSVSVPTQLDDDPLASDRIWREMSSRLPVYNLSLVSRPKPTAHVLIAATTPDQGAGQRAFLSWQYVGLGRVIYIAAPITYQLRYGIGDLYHHRFWGQLLRWAVAREMAGGSKTVHLLTDKNRYEVGEQAQIVLRLTASDGTPVAAAQCSVEAIRENQMIKVIELHEEAGSPGAYRGIFAGLPAGPLTLRAAGATVQSLLAGEGRTDPVEQLLNVDIKGTTELSDPVCNLPLLNQIADASGGVLLPPASLQNALAHLNVAPDSQDTVLSRQPVWDRWSLLWVFMCCLTIEWLARRYWRML
jgi:hypothetical protein